MFYIAIQEQACSSKSMKGFMMVEFKDAAIRHELIKTVLQHSARPLSVNDIYEIPKIREHCKGSYNVSDSLAFLHKQKFVRKTPIIDGSKSRLGWEFGIPNSNENEILRNANIRGANMKPKAKAEQLVKPIKKDKSVKTLPDAIPAPLELKTIIEPVNVVELLPMLEFLLSPQEILGFYKGALVAFQEQRQDILDYLSNGKVLEPAPASLETAPAAIEPSAPEKSKPAAEIPSEPSTTAVVTPIGAVENKEPVYYNPNADAAEVPRFAAK